MILAGKDVQLLKYALRQSKNDMPEHVTCVDEEWKKTLED